jgi:uncharacterized membrane protein
MGVSVRVASGESVSTPSARDREGSEIEFSRVVAFSDGVFSIAITLLVLALQIPAGLNDLGQELRDRGDEFFAYGLSFAVIGSLWIDHHGFFGSLRAFDGRLMGLNLLYLAFVALVPFTSQVLGTYAGESAAVILYAANMVAISVAFTLQISYSYRSGLMSAEARDQRGGQLETQSIVIPAVFALSIPVALVIPQQTPWVWILIPVLMRVLGPRRPKADR